MNPSLLEIGQYYHIYNCGINGENLFKEAINYEYFMQLYGKYIEPIADTFAWCLMPNHFHLLVRIKENVVYKYSNTDRSIDAVRFQEIKWETQDLSACEASGSVEEITKRPDATRHLSHLFNSYAKYFNKKYKRHGALFERPFKRKLIASEGYFTNLVVYIHNNPVHHGFAEHILDWGWSSYLSCVSDKPTKLQRETVKEWFGNIEYFKAMHNDKIEMENMEHWLGL